MSLRLAPTKKLQPAPADDQRPKGKNPPLRRWWLFAVPSRSIKQPDLNIRGPLLTTYKKRLSIGLFGERLNWANNFIIIILGLKARRSPMSHLFLTR